MTIKLYNTFFSILLGITLLSHSMLKSSNKYFITNTSRLYIQIKDDSDHKTLVSKFTMPSRSLRLTIKAKIKLHIKQLRTARICPQIKETKPLIFNFLQVARIHLSERLITEKLL